MFLDFFWHSTEKWERWVSNWRLDCDSTWLMSRRLENKGAETFEARKYWLRIQSCDLLSQNAGILITSGCFESFNHHVEHDPQWEDNYFSSTDIVAISVKLTLSFPFERLIHRFNSNVEFFEKFKYSHRWWQQIIIKFVGTLKIFYVWRIGVWGCLIGKEKNACIIYSEQNVFGEIWRENFS